MPSLAKPDLRYLPGKTFRGDSSSTFRLFFWTNSSQFFFRVTSLLIMDCIFQLLPEFRSCAHLQEQKDGTVLVLDNRYDFEFIYFILTDFKLGYQAFIPPFVRGFHCENEIAEAVKYRLFTMNFISGNIMRVVPNNGICPIFCKEPVLLYHPWAWKVVNFMSSMDDYQNKIGLLPGQILSAAHYQ
jgi:hypothetical protein